MCLIYNYILKLNIYIYYIEIKKDISNPIDDNDNILIIIKNYLKIFSLILNLSQIDYKYINNSNNTTFIDIYINLSDKLSSYDEFIEIYNNSRGLINIRSLLIKN